MIDCLSTLSLPSTIEAPVTTNDIASQSLHGLNLIALDLDNILELTGEAQ